MTDTEINIAIAEACGWTKLQCEWRFPQGATLETLHVVQSASDGDVSYYPPTYTTDLNAMHEAEKTLSIEDRLGFIAGLGGIGQEPELQEWWDAVHCTARQRAEAFLRTIGKWKGEVK